MTSPQSSKVLGRFNYFTVMKDYVHIIYTPDGLEGNCLFIAARNIPFDEAKSVIKELNETLYSLKDYIGQNSGEFREEREEQI